MKTILDNSYLSDEYKKKMNYWFESYTYILEDYVYELEPYKF